MRVFRSPGRFWKILLDPVYRRVGRLFRWRGETVVFSTIFSPIASISRIPHLSPTPLSKITWSILVSALTIGGSLIAIALLTVYFTASGPGSSVTFWQTLAIGVFIGVVILMTVYNTWEHIRQTRALSDSEERYRNLVQGSIQGILIHRHLKPLFVNQAYADMLGYNRPDEVLMLPTIEPHLAPYERDRLWRYNQARLTGKSAPVQYEYDALRKDGVPIVLQNVARVIQWDGEPAVQVTVMDITERRRAEALARHKQAELARVARFSVMTEMASSLAHQLNQPLTAITSYCDAALALQSGGSDELREILEQTIQQAQRAHEIVRQIKRFIGGGSTERTAVVINEMIKEMVEFTQAEIHEKNIIIKLELAESLPAVPVDKLQIEQVILNLLHNSIEAMDGTPCEMREITLYTGRQEGKLKVTIQDTGPGLSQAMIERIFNPFETDKSNGLGMGLAISRSIIEAHRGRLWAEPRSGGAAFHFTLPLNPVSNGSL